jgi:hypothetical protein
LSAKKTYWPPFEELREFPNRAWVRLVPKVSRFPHSRSGRQTARGNAQISRFSVLSKGRSTTCCATRMFVATRKLMKYSKKCQSLQRTRRIGHSVRGHLRQRPGPHHKRRITCAGTNLKNRLAKSHKPEHKSNYPATQAEIRDRRALRGATNGKTALA